MTMETTQTTLFLLASLFSAVAILHAAARDAVLDIDGKAVVAGTDYYILPVMRGRGGGVALGARRNRTCPLDVVQASQEVSNGLPLTFSPVNSPKDGIVRLSADNNIKFSAATVCAQSTVWRLDGADSSTQQWFVTTGGEEGNPGRETLSNWFAIDKYDNDYKIFYCPTVCEICRPRCGDVGIYVKDGVRRLALSNEPFRVMFKKATK